MASFSSFLLFLLAALILIPQGLATYYKPPIHKHPIYKHPIFKPPVYKHPIYKPPYKKPPYGKYPPVENNNHA
ncbi:unnamed protein product [Sphenostylis stenocarpa]|uniref:Uncharacterized protein n=1 Tax=Sphenostylis stenocarpa TaxID=92480 RepID=A0AA86SPM6_9FABA|nr:unnamed protein product [Sphenostylis stenocarpa]